MKAKNIEENSFEIYVQYKSGKDDEFSFYINNDKLILQDFTFTKELVSIGVKPSGEPIVQVDVLANELVKHFKSLSEVKEGEGDDHHYIKVTRPEFKDAEKIIGRNIDGNHVKMDYVDDDGAGNVIIYFMFKDGDIASGEAESFMHDLVMDLAAYDIDVVDHSIRDLHETEGEKDMNEPDIDVGHVDDEPDMLQNTAYETTQYAAKLVKKLQKYNQHDGEVDFPNWWQSKLILAREYISSAYHYLDSKEKQPALDQLALENVDKVAGGIPYKREGNKFIISEPLDDATKERIIGRAKEHGHHAAPNMAGGVTIMAKEGKKIKLSKGDPTNMAYTDKVNEGRGDMDMITQIIDDRAAESGFDVKEEAAEVIMAIADAYGLDVKNLGDYVGEGKYKSDAQRKAIYATKAEKGELKEENGLKEFEKEYLSTQFGSSFADDYPNTKKYSIESLYAAFEELHKKKGLDYEEFFELVDNGKIKPKAEKNEGFNHVQSQYDDLTQVVKNIAHVGEMSIHDAAYNAVGHIEDEFGIDLTEPDQNIHEDSIDKIQKGLEVVKRHIKTHLEMYKDAESPENKQLAVNMLKKLNAQKKQLEKHLEDRVAGIGRDQELDIDEAGPGFKHDCAAKVVHEKYGKGNTIPEKHTLVKEGNKYGVTHYDVLFENGNTVLDIPVNELDIKTTNEHWHKGYKKKKK